MTEAQPVVVALAADSAFAKQLAVTIAGISMCATRDHHVFVLHDGYAPDLIETISKTASEAVELSWLDAWTLSFEGAHLPSKLPPATMFRLRIGDLLPKEIERVIYIDTDVAIRRPLDELWEIDLAGKPIGAVRDALLPWAARAGSFGGLRSEMDIPADSPYFNSGVLVIQTGPWRSERIEERALELLKRQLFQNGDQCALNAILDDSWTPLEPRWNQQASHFLADSLALVTESRDALARAIDDPAIVHFLHSPLRRPWDYGCTHPYRDLWFEHLDHTPFAGWRPARRSVAQRAMRRIRRAGGVLIRG